MAALSQAWTSAEASLPLGWPTEIVLVFIAAGLLGLAIHADGRPASRWAAGA